MIVLSLSTRDPDDFAELQAYVGEAAAAGQEVQIKGAVLPSTRRVRRALKPEHRADLEAAQRRADAAHETIQRCVREIHEAGAHFDESSLYYARQPEVQDAWYDWAAEERTLGSLSVACRAGSKLYDELAESGALRAAFPAWYAAEAQAT